LMKVTVWLVDDDVDVDDVDVDVDDVDVDA
jgi:hypothetical protein